MDLQELYQEVIVDHNRRPRNFGRLEGANRHAEGYNPLCGDRLTVYLRVDDDTIEDVSFEGEGCAISVASASLMTDYLKGRNVEDAEAAFGTFREMVTNRDANAEPPESLGKLAALGGVRAYPSRVKCATLCWHTLQAAAHGESEATTE